VPQATDRKTGRQTAGGKGGGNGNQQLLNEYVLGDVLGQGAFGVVYACAKKGTKDFKFAVKMVDKVETPVAEIKKEAEMMGELAHPNVVKFYAVYYEKCFVCIVMDKYGGGDLIEGMQAHWQSKGKIPPLNVVHVARQATLAIDHLHRKGYVHRDIKGDNYLTDRKDITDPNCRLLMSDFGTAMKLKKASERVKGACGTKIYWPPEFYTNNYGQKVDIWALGVIMYGLVDGRFPFKNEQDSRNKPVRLPSSCPPKCKDFVEKLLDKSEDKRLSAADAIRHAWVSDGQPAPPVADPSAVAASSPDWSPDTFREGGANAGQDERRMELIERLEKAAEKRETKGPNSAAITNQLAVLWAGRFDVFDKRSNKSIRYEWWNPAKVKTDVLDVSLAVSGGNDNATVTAETVKKELEQHNIDTSKFGQGQAKTLEKFAEELSSGSASLMLDACEHKKLVRVVDVVLLRMTYTNGNKTLFLREFSDTFADGRGRKDLNRLPGSKKEAYENTKKTASRIVQEQLGILETTVSMDFEGKEIFEEQEESLSFPGVMTVYRKEIVECKVISTDKAVLSKIGCVGDPSFSCVDDKKTTKVYNWWTEKDCTKRKIKLRAPADGEEVSGLVQAPIGFGEEELEKFLTANKVDCTLFGQNGAKTVKDFSTELIKGECSLNVTPCGTVVRIVDVVLLWLTKKDIGDVLVESQEKAPDGTTKPLNHLPGTKRRPDENHFVAAKRALKRRLKMDENFVNLDASSVKVIEEKKASASYPGLETLYRKRIISAELMPSQIQVKPGTE